MSSPKNLKMCQSCRGLIAANAAVCPLCGNESHYAGSKMTALSVTWAVNTILLTVNLAVYGLMIIYQAKVWGLPEDSSGLGMWSPASDLLDAFGAVLPNKVAAGQYWRLLTMCFLHGGPLHLGFNSYALMQVGREAEEAYGGAKYLCVYLTAGLTGSLVVVAVGQAAVGASGAIFGVIGAMAVYGYKRGDMYGRVLKSSMVRWLIYGLVMSFIPGISMAGHVGGLLGGAGMAYMLSDVEQTRQRLKLVRWWQAAASVAVLLALVSFALAALNVRRETEVRAVQQLTVPVFKAADAFARWQKLDDDETFDQYRSYLGATVTTLELTRAVDDESAALQQRMLDLLHERRDQLKQAESLAAAPMASAKLEAFRGAFKEFENWIRRQSQRLGVPEGRLRLRWSFPEKGPSRSVQESSRPPS